MFEQIEWKTVYETWKSGCYDFPDILSQPVKAETIFVDYKQDGYFYGYDWLSNENISARKDMIKNRLPEFLYFVRPSNKGTIQTAEMLTDAKDAEELAAIWIAATAKELSDSPADISVRHHADMLYRAARNFLKDRFYLWHPSMRRLVPDIMIPLSVLQSITCQDITPIIGIIQLNTILLKNHWGILIYSSLKDEAAPKSRYRILNN